MKKVITVKYIKTLNPCVEGIDNFEKHYPKFKGKLSELLTLENVPYSDKIWLASKVAPIEVLRQWSVECAEFVLDVFENDMPGDRRVRDCIEATKRYLNGEIAVEELIESRNAAANAANAAYADAANAAYAAASAAANAANAAYAAYAAASAAANAADAGPDVQESINLSILIALLDNIGA